MDPIQQAAPRDDGFKPKWRHFSPMARVWVKNPFAEDIVFQVADEHNRPYRYSLPAGKTSELPGGAIATLGVKHIVDRLICDVPEDAARMWDEDVRSRYEKDVILRVKESTPTAGATANGIINLESKDNSGSAPVEQPVTKEPETAFPTLNQSAEQVAPLPAEAKAGLDDLVSASLPKADVAISANNAHTNVDG